MTEDIAHLSPPILRPPQRHALGPEMRIARELSPSGFEQIERSCQNCGAVKITIMGQESPRAWRRSSDGVQVATSTAPPCDRDAEWT